MNLQDRGIIKCGMLTKSPPMDTKTRRRWHSRYFVLYDPARIQRDDFEFSRGMFHRTPSFSERATRCLQRKNTIEEPSFLSLIYYKDEESKKKSQAAISIISLEGATVNENPEPLRGHKYVINLNTEQRVYHLCADTQDEHKSWLHALQKTLSRNEPVAPSSSIPETNKKGGAIEDVPPEKNSMIQQLIEWKRERLLLEQQSKEEENTETRWLENKLMADLDITDDDKKKDSGFSEKYGLYNSNNDVTEGNAGGNDDISGEAFQDRIQRLSLESMQEKGERISPSKTLQRNNTTLCYENVPTGSEYSSTTFYTKSKVGRSRSFEHSTQYYNKNEILNSTELCSDAYTTRPYSTLDPPRPYTDTHATRPNLQWQLAVSDDGFEEEEYDGDGNGDDAPALPVKTYAKTLPKSTEHPSCHTSFTHPYFGTKHVIDEEDIHSVHNESFSSVGSTKTDDNLRY